MISRLVGAAAMVAAATVLLLLARDTWDWGRTMRDADARAAVAPVPPDAWQATPLLPRSLARRLLAIDDDLEFRSTVMQALRETSSTPTPKMQKRRSLVESALARIERGDADRHRASLAADLLGLLLYTDPPSPDQAANAYEDPTQTGPSNQQTPEQKAKAQFELAARLDPDNDAAQRNLELMLRQPSPPPQQGSPQAGAGERFGNKGSGARPPGRGY